MDRKQETDPARKLEPDLDRKPEPDLARKLEPDLEQESVGVRISEPGPLQIVLPQSLPQALQGRPSHLIIAYHAFRISGMSNY